MSTSNVAGVSESMVDDVKQRISQLASFPEKSQIMVGAEGFTKISDVQAMMEKAKGFWVWAIGQASQL